MKKKHIKAEHVLNRIDNESRYDVANWRGLLAQPIRSGCLMSLLFIIALSATSMRGKCMARKTIS